MGLSGEELSRYSRHILLPQVGRAGQERLRSASVALVGLGGLGCPAALYLAAAGIGRLALIDSDQADITNLQRQILHGRSDIGRPKVESAADKLHAINDTVALDLHPLRLSAENALRVLEPYDVIVEGTDNFGSKFLVNDAALALGKPLVSAGILRFEGQLMSVKPGSSACFRCLFESIPAADAVPSCAEAGVLGAVAGVLGSLLANEVLKIILGIGEPLYDRLLCFDALRGAFREVTLRQRPDCPSCASAGKRQALHDELAPDCTI